MTTWPGVAVTGHRDLTDGQMAWLRPELDRVNLKLAGEHGTTGAATGMALKADQEFGWSALFAGMTLHAHIPFPEQPDRWPTADQDAYRRLLARCATRTVYGPSYDVKWLFARNDGLLDFAEERAGVLVAVWDPRVRKGGTFDTVLKAARRGLPAIHFEVERLQVHGPGCSCIEPRRALTRF
ncbi:hypothetical protein ACFFX1_55605 [Dactylosporangium sucinum]|uniref:Uncharacterized protein n=1 Tax=Dactylosporangium sucinum TaxID=1424081 RepID=A0A917X1C6_9ACTN|nr:hypothetical protein [Dactylosporangium sucinum]GGM52362.1 hypothetical protein GCM10007977_062430 [Dactylosporangium sucinum]